MMLEGLKSLARSCAEANAGEVQGKGDGEEGHGSGHREARLQHGLAERAEGVGDAGAEGKNVGGGEGWLGDCGGNESGAAEEGVGSPETIVAAEDDGWLGCSAGGLTAGLGDDAFEQGGGGSGRGDFSISIQAAPRWASASMVAQLGQPTRWRSKVA